MISRGFTYIGLLLSIAMLGAALATAGLVWHTQVRREQERELLFVGEQFRRAIGMYYERSPGEKKFPDAIDELLLDPRFPNVQRYLRRIYVDPVTGSRDWGIVEGPGGGIMGVYSQAQARPLKQANFRPSQSDFEARERYSDWRFVYVPQAALEAVHLPAPKD